MRACRAATSVKAEIRSLASAGDAELESPVSWVWESPHKVRVSRRGLVVLWGNDEQGLVRPQGECWGLGPLTQTLTWNCIRGREGIGGVLCQQLEEVGVVGGRESRSPERNL